MMRKPLALVAVVLTMTACSREPEPELVVEDLGANAVELARSTLVVDGHVDYPYRQVDEPADISVLADGRNFDYVKAKEGGLDAPFMSIYIPSSYQESGGAKELADELIGLIETLETEHPDKFAIARSPDDVEAQFAQGLVSLPMGMENGEPIEGDLSNVQYFYDRGIRYIGLTHGANNHLSDSSYADERQWNGISPFGREVVAEMNRLGILIDTSHLSDEAFWQIADITTAPLIASHSSCRHFTPGWERNISDEMIQRMAEGGGVVMINYGNGFLRQDANEQGTAYWAAFQEADVSGEEARTWSEAYWKEHDRIWPTVSDVADHIDHVVDLVGVDSVGLGSDFDGVGDNLPTGLKTAADLPNLFHELLERGYSEGDIEKIASGNILRVWREVERVAATSSD